MGLRMKNFDTMGVHWKNQYIGGDCLKGGKLGQFHHSLENERVVFLREVEIQFLDFSKNFILKTFLVLLKQMHVFFLLFSTFNISYIERSLIALSKSAFIIS